MRHFDLECILAIVGIVSAAVVLFLAIWMLLVVGFWIKLFIFLLGISIGAMWFATILIYQDICDLKDDSYGKL